MDTILKSRSTRILSLLLAVLMIFFNVSPSILACGTGCPGGGEYYDCIEGVDLELEDYEDFAYDDYDWDDYSDIDWDDEAGGYEDAADFEEWEDDNDIEEADDLDYDYDEDFDDDNNDDFADDDVDIDDLDDPDVDIDEDFDFKFSEGGSGSCEGGSCGTQDSISGYSGNLHLKIDLFTLETKGVPIEISLHYNSQGRLKANSPFGYKWKFNFDISLEEVEYPEWMEDHDDIMVRHMSDGGAYYYERDTFNVWLPTEGHHGKLERLPDWTWVETMKNGVKYYFTSGGRLSKIETVHGNPVSFFYDAEGYIDYITDCTGRSIDFIREGTKITDIYTPDNKQYHLSYANGELTRYEDPVGKYVDFGYNNTGAHFLETCTYPPVNGQYRVRYEYDGTKVKFRVKEIINPTVILLTREFEYSPGRKTTITDVNYKRKVVEFNDAGQPIQIDYYSKGIGDNYVNLRTEKMDYSADGSLLWSEDGRGYRTSYEYNDRGDRKSKRYMEKLGEDNYNTLEEITYDYYAAGHPSEHKLSMIRNARGNEVNYTYDYQGNLETKSWTMTDYDETPHSLVEIRSYYQDGQLETVTDPKGNITTYYYDPHGHLEEINKVNGLKITKYVNDDMGRKVREEELIDSGSNRWKTTDYERDDIGRVFKVTYNDDPYDVGRFNFNCCSLENSEDRDGNVTYYEYEPSGKLYKKTITITNNLGPTIEASYYYEHDGLGRLIYEVDPRGNTIWYNYDGLNRVTKITDELGNQAVMQYDANSNLRYKTVYLDGRAITTEMRYDDYNRLEYVETPINETLDAITKYEYDAGGNMVKFTDAKNRVSTFEYDEMGHLVVSHEPLEKNTYYKYDFNGNLSSITDALGRTTTFSYNALNRLTDVYKPIDSTRELHTKYTYDNIGNKTFVTLYDVINGEDHTTSFEYNKDCRVTKLTDPEGKTIDYEYTKGGNLSKITDDNGVSTEYYYDQAGRNIRVVYAAGTSNQREEQFYFDGVGNLKIKKLRSGENIEFTYDDLNRLDTKIYPAPDSRVIDYDYDDLGRVEFVTMTLYGTVGYQYDDLNRMTNVIYPEPDSKTVQYEYDEVGNLTKITYPDGSYYIKYTHDGLNRISQIGRLEVLQAGYSYYMDPLRRKALIRNLSGIQATTGYSYNDADWIVGLSNYVVGGSGISNFSYTYDRVGNRISMARGGVQNNDEYQYNKRYELHSVNYHQGSPFADKTFNYDGVGNRISVVNGGTVTYGINELNQYTTVGGVAHVYDLRGNLTSDGNNSYTYDLDNRLTGINGTVSYEYDPFGRRIKKTVNGTDTNYVYDGDRVIEERDGSDNLLRRFVYGVGIDEVLWVEDASGNKFWYYYDALGSVVNISDNAGNLVSTIHYDVYGDFVETGSFTSNPYKFTGRRYDSESGLFYYRARMYSPGLGRFLQNDPVGYIGGPHLYSYCENNPLSWYDPFGLESTSYWDMGVAIAKYEANIAKKYLDEARSDAISAWNAHLDFHYSIRVAARNVPNNGLANSGAFLASAEVIGLGSLFLSAAKAALAEATISSTVSSVGWAIIGGEIIWIGVDIFQGLHDRNKLQGLHDRNNIFNSCN